MMTLAIALCFVLLAPLSYLKAQVNAGFINGLWFSPYPFFANETVRLYAALQNNSGFDIKGKAAFFDKNERIGESSFSVVNGRLLEVWTDWHAREGDHAMAVKITEAFKMEIGKDPQPITLMSASFTHDPITIEKDTDGDRVGDSQDTDDDNDGLSDNEEQQHETNPLVADSDDDGISDKKEITVGTDPLKPPQKKSIQNTDTGTSTRFLNDKANVTTTLLKEIRKKYAPRVTQTIKKAADALDERANNAATIIRARKEALKPTQYQPLFSVSLALLLSFIQYWRVAAGIFAGLFLWLIVRRMRRV